jgi:hypothetical protein
MQKPRGLDIFRERRGSVVANRIDQRGRCEARFEEGRRQLDGHGFRSRVVRRHEQRVGHIELAPGPAPPSERGCDSDLPANVVQEPGDLQRSVAPPTQKSGDLSSSDRRCDRVASAQWTG